MRTEITSILEKIENSLSRLSYPVISLLNQGLTKEQIEVALATINLSPNDELVELYSWKNGTNTPEGVLLGEIWLLPGFYFLSMQEALEWYRELRKTPDWNQHWFPIFANGGGDFYALDLSLSSKQAIIAFMVYEGGGVAEYASLSTMLKTYQRCFEEGIIFKNDEGYLDMDYEQQAKIAHQLNPQIQVWSD